MKYIKIKFCFMNYWIFKQFIWLLKKIITNLLKKIIKFSYLYNNKNNKLIIIK